MSIIKKPYTISVWDDVWNGEKFVEKRVCIIGSDKMESQCRAIEPNLTRNTNGTKKLTFKLYKRYKDNITGELVENPFYDWLVNERKVKLKYDGKWYDFVVKNIQENSSNYLYTYQLEDALAQELSKNGFNVELNDELMNNSGTAKELADKVLEETDWDVESEPFIERIEESLVWLTVRSGHSLKAQKIVDKGMTTGEVELGAGTNILAFYSSCANTPYRFQFIYVDGGLPKITKDDNRLITNADCQYYIDNPTYYEPKENDSDYNDYATARAYGFVLPVDLNTTTVEETENSTGVTLSGEYRAKRYGFTQKSVFSPVLNRYINIYKRIDSNGKVVDEEYYGYLNTEYKSPVLTQNILSNTEFTSTTGWIGTKEQGGKLATTENVVFRLNEKGERTDIKLIDDLSTTDINKHQYASYMKLTFKNNTSMVINSGPYDNRVSIGNMEVGEEYALICAYDENNNPNLDFDLGEYTYQTGDSGYYAKDNSKIVFKKKDTDLPAGITAIFTVKSNTYSKKTFKKRSQVRLAITGIGTTYISNISLFKVVRDDNGNIILPENQTEDINDRVIDTTYYFFKKDTLTSATNEEEVKPDATLKALDYSQFIPVINEDAQKIRTISAKESNYFNILQSIAETFEAWLDFEITRDPETGAITYKKVKFRNYIGKENPVGFKYGINLKDIQRTFESKQIVTKLIVKDNKNEFATNGFCSIARAGANPTGENYIYDFQYFFNRGLLSARDYLDTLYSYGKIEDSEEEGAEEESPKAEGPDFPKDSGHYSEKYNLYGYFPRIKALNRKIDERNEILINLSKDITTLKAKYEVAQTGAEAASSNMEEAAADYVKTTGEEITATLPAGWKDRTDVQKILQSYATYKIERDKYVAEESTLEGELKSVQEQYNTLANEIDGYKKHKIALNQLFFSRYSRFIQEGTWIDESYVDDEKYYADAQSTLYNSCYPKAAYTVNVIEISKLPGYEDFTYDLGDKTFIEDKEFFGSAAKVEVVLTETTDNLDDPTKNKLKIQTFKNQFQDLFQKITATVQQTQYSTGSYEKAVALAEANQERKNQFVTDALDGADARLQVAGQQSVEIGDDGITITDVDTPSDKIRMVGGAILLSKQDKNGETKWVTGVTSDGVSASLITAGVLNAGEISIMNYDEPLFRWDSFGLSAFDNSDYTDENGIVVISGVNPNKFVRFDKYGIYGVNGGVNGANWHPGLNTEDTPQEDIDKKATFALTWEGLKVTGNGGTAHIGKHNNAIIRVTNGTNDTFVVDNSGNVTVRGNLQVGNGNSVEDFVSDEISKVDASAQQYAAAAAEAVREDLQEQIDGEITSWFYEGEPTLENEPAKNWVNKEDKIRHEGDLYYNTTSGRAYRWIYNNTKNAHEWTIITDEAIAKALAAAQSAQSTADGKMTVFSTQPNPPYQIGDLWVNATYDQYSNDLLRCKAQKDTGSFDIEDWELASKYTDDTKANEALNSANNANDKYTTLSGDISNGKGIFAEGIGKVVNKEYIDKFEIQAGSIIIFNKNNDGTSGDRIFSAEPILKNNGTLTGGVYLAGWTVTDKQLSYCDEGQSLGQVGTFGIYPKGISSGLSGFSGSLTSGDAWVITAGKDFGVTKNGALYASSGKIGGWTLGSDFLRAGSSKQVGIISGTSGGTKNGSSVRFFAGNATPNEAPFIVTEDGSLYATKGTFTGDISGASGTFTGNLSGSTITGSTITGSAIRGGTIIIGEEENPGFYVNTDGDVWLSGAISWGADSSPVQVLYNDSSSARIPTGLYKDFVDGKDGWYKIQGNRRYASYTYDGGNSWGPVVQVIGESMVNCYIESLNGSLFEENTTGSITLTARIYQGTTEIDPNGNELKYTWYIDNKKDSSLAGKQITIAFSNIKNKLIHFEAE